MGPSGWHIGPDGWNVPDKACENFNGYSSNIQLCKSCHRPITEHVAYMERHKAKEKKREEEKKLKEYQQKREKLMELCRREIDAPEVERAVESTEYIEFGGGKMTREYFEMRNASGSGAGDCEKCSC